MAKPTKSLAARFWNKVIIGLAIVTPLLATALIFKFFVELVTKWIPVAAIQGHMPDWSWISHAWLLRIVVLLLTLVLLFVIGLSTRNFLGKWFYKTIDVIFSRIPGVSAVYTFVRQICTWIATSRKQVFKSVAIVEYPSTGIFSLALVTSDTPRDIAMKAAGRDMVNVFLPTTPNPTSGFYLMFPRDKIIPVDIDVPTAINLIISAGAILPKSESRNEMIAMIDSLAEDHEKHGIEK